MTIANNLLSDAVEYVRRALKDLRILQIVGPADPELDLGNTPERIVKMWLEFTAGYRTKPPEVTVFESEHDQMLVLKGIAVTSLCSHHFAPFQGVAHIGYIPSGKIVGISKPARVLDYFAAQPQTQERLTAQVADFLMKKLEPLGVGVIIEATHSCISCRGAKKSGSSFITSVMRGVFLDSPEVRQEFLSLIGV